MITAFIASLPLAAIVAQQYSVRVLAPVALAPAAARFEPGTRATAIGTDGTAGGASVTDTDSRNVHACRWLANGRATDLGTLGTDVHSMVLGGNATGDLVGASFSLGALDVHGVLWGADGAVTPLGNVEPVAINAARQVAANARAAGNPPACFRAVRWSAGTQATLPTLGGGPSARAAGISEAGWIAGCAVLADRMTTHACVWTGTGAPIDLGTLGGTSSFARDIAGATVVGTADAADGVPHACRWNLSATGAVTSIDDLGTLPGAPGSSAEAIAADGRIGGNSGDSAVLFEGAAVIDLNARIAPGSGWRLTHVTAFGAGGRIAGRGRWNGIPRGFVLEPQASPADFDGNGQVNGSDLAVLLSRWGSSDPACDLNGDGSVGGADLAMLLVQWSAG